MLPRGSGKSTLIAAYGVYRFFTDGEGAMVCVVAVDERQAGIVFGIARRMVELNDDLNSRVQVFKDRIYNPTTDSNFHCLPAEPKRLEGLDYTLAVLDEAGVASRESYETLTLAQGKRERSTLVAIGTPGPTVESPLMDLRAAAIANPGDTSLVWVEHSAAGFEDHPVDCAHCWTLANPALDDFLHRDALVALLPPKTRESTFRRARLCQIAVDREAEFIPASVWRALGTGEGIADGSEVVLALDGSFSDDTTALLLATVNEQPHFDPLAVWEKPASDEGWRVPIDEPGFTGENTVIPERDVDFDEVALLPSAMQSVKVLTKFSNELARQSVIALDAALQQRLVTDVATKIDTAFLSAGGDGTTTPKGMFAWTGTQTVPVGGAITFDALLDAWGKALSANVNLANLKWLMRSREFIKLRKLKDGDDRYQLTPDPSVAGGFQLFGIPVIVTDRVPDTTGRTPTARAALVDFSQIAVARDLAPSVTLLDQTFADYDQQAIRVVTRYDVAPLNPEAVVTLTGITI